MKTFVTKDGHKINESQHDRLHWKLVNQMSIIAKTLDLLNRNPNGCILAAAADTYDEMSYQADVTRHLFEQMLAPESDKEE